MNLFDPSEGAVDNLPPLKNKIYIKWHTGKAYKIRVLAPQYNRLHLHFSGRGYTLPLGNGIFFHRILGLLKSKSGYL